MIPNRSEANAGYGYSQPTALYVVPPKTNMTSSSDHGTNSPPQTFAMSNGMVVSNGSTNDHMKAKVVSDEFSSRYEDLSHWTSTGSNSHGVTSNAPWSLPFLSTALSGLPPIQSSIHLRQRNDSNRNHPHHYGNHSNMNNGYHRQHHPMKGMMPNQGRHNMDGLYVPSIRSRQDSYTNDPDHHHYQQQPHHNDADESDDDPIPLSEIFAESTMDRSQNGKWYTTAANGATTTRLTSNVSVRPPYSTALNTSSDQHQQQRPHLRRVSNFNESNEKDIDINNPNDEVVSSAGSLTTIEMYALRHPMTPNDGSIGSSSDDNHCSDSFTMIATTAGKGDDGVEEDTTSVAIIAIGDTDDDDDDDTNDHHSNHNNIHPNTTTTTTTTTTTVQPDDDMISTVGMYCSISDSSTCSSDIQDPYNGTTGGSSSSSSNSSIAAGNILYNDLCLSPLWCSTTSLSSSSSSPEMDDNLFFCDSPFMNHHDSTSHHHHHHHHSMNEIQQLQLPVL
jgi:hypothetical protein